PGPVGDSPLKDKKGPGVVVSWRAPQPRLWNVVVIRERRYSSRKRSADCDTTAITDGLIKLFGNAFDPLCGRIECANHGVGCCFGAVRRDKASGVQGGDLLVQSQRLPRGFDELVGEHQCGHDCQARVADLSKFASQIDNALVNVVRKRLQLFFLSVLASEAELSAGNGCVHLAHVDLTRADPPPTELM